MEFEKKFVQNYLTRPHFSGGQIMAIILFGVCFVLSQFFWDASYNFSHYLAANAKLVFGEGQWWRLLTTLFVHADLKHLLSNCLMLVVLTYFVSSFYGKLNTILIFLVGGMSINVICLSVYPESTYLVGASGGIYLLWGFWLSLYFFIETRYTLIQRILRAGGVFLILLVPTSFEPTTSYLAHYAGFGIGASLGVLYYIIKRKILHKFELWEYTLIEPNIEENWDDAISDDKVLN